MEVGLGEGGHRQASQAAPGTPSSPRVPHPRKDNAVSQVLLSSKAWPTMSLLWLLSLPGTLTCFRMTSGLRAVSVEGSGMVDIARPRQPSPHRRACCQEGIKHEGRNGEDVRLLLPRLARTGDGGREERESPATLSSRAMKMMMPP